MIFRAAIAVAAMFEISGPGFEQEAVNRRIVSNPTLRRGDIISMSSGFLVFTGRDDDPSSADFQKTEEPR
ncbi:MAG: hypothetical protein J0H40_14595 [Rhizobiales bacterium]|nr:hypothetical protein [Hyphomicrobiales bacterium]